MGGAKQRWLVAIGVFWVLYVVYALTTPTEVQSVDQGKAALIRIVIATGWLAVAAGLLCARSEEATDWPCARRRALPRAGYIAPATLKRAPYINVSPDITMSSKTAASSNIHIL